MKPQIKRTVAFLALLGLVGAAAVWYLQRGSGQALSYRTAPVTRGDLLISISATGTLEPEEVIDVGAQVAGQILSFGKDANGKTVDYGSVVEQGTVLALIDDSLYAADVEQAEAQIQAAEASLKRAEAELVQMKAKLRQAERDWQRAQKLGPSEALAQASYDAYQSTYETARANVAVGNAAILQAKANLAEEQASARRAQRNLGYCTIKSPVKGVIIDRRVNIGQTVVASLNAPSLFLIAKDLTRMQVWVAVNEADIGKIHPRQPVQFTVDAFPSETFTGEVGKIRLNASMTQNVVTYTVEVITNNADGHLLPYLTANLQFELNNLSDVLLVPNAALRWMPSAEQVVSECRGAFENLAEGEERLQGVQIPGSKSASSTDDGKNQGVLWVLQGQQVRPVQVRVGLSDGAVTEVEGENLTEGLSVVTGMQKQARRQADASNPFTPQFPGRSRRPATR